MSVAAKDDSEYAPYSNGHAPAMDKDEEKFDEEELDEKAVRRRASVAEGQIKHNKLGWKRLTVCHALMTSTYLHGHHDGCAQSMC